MKCITYLRVASSDISDQQMGFNYQQQIINDYVTKNNYSVISTIREVGVYSSSKSTLEILNKVEKQKIDAVICISIDRVGRNPEDYHHLRSCLNQFGVKLIFAKSGSEASDLTPFDQAVTIMKDAINLLVKAEHSRRTKEGIKKRKEQSENK